MTRTVLKPFNTRTQRFTAGVPVPPGTDLSPFTADDLAARGFISGDPETPAVRRPRTSERSK
jgi:hypothetical protein